MFVCSKSQVDLIVKDYVRLCLMSISYKSPKKIILVYFKCFCNLWSMKYNMWMLYFQLKDIMVIITT